MNKKQIDNNDNNSLEPSSTAEVYQITKILMMKYQFSNFEKATSLARELIFLGVGLDKITSTYYWRTLGIDEIIQYLIKKKKIVELKRMTSSTTTSDSLSSIEQKTNIIEFNLNSHQKVKALKGARICQSYQK